jgi:hypothetical protein
MKYRFRVNVNTERLFRFYPYPQNTSSGNTTPFFRMMLP